MAERALHDWHMTGTRRRAVKFMRWKTSWEISRGRSTKRSEATLLDSFRDFVKMGSDVAHAI